MRLTSGQERQVKDGIRELRKLATLESCSLDNETKEKMKTWVTWIDVYVEKIESALNNDLWDGYYYNE